LSALLDQLPRLADKSVTVIDKVEGAVEKSEGIIQRLSLRLQVMFAIRSIATALLVLSLIGFNLSGFWALEPMIGHSLAALCCAAASLLLVGIGIGLTRRHLS